MFLPGSFRKLLFSRTNGPTLQSRAARSWVFGTARWKYFSRVAKRCLGLVFFKPSSPVNWSESQYVASCGSSWIQSIKAEIRWNFCSTGYECCFASGMLIGNAVPDDFIKEFVVDEKIEFALTPRYLGRPWWTEDSATLIPLNIFDHWSGFGGASSESALTSSFLMLLSPFSSPPSSAKTSTLELLALSWGCWLMRASISSSTSRSDSCWFFGDPASFGWFLQQ